MAPDPSTVLVVDDHPIFRAGIAALFDSAGYRTVGQAVSAAEAVTLPRDLQPDLIIMDLGLPDGSGVTATAQIVGDRAAARVLVVTMFDDDGSVRDALDAGARGYVVKDASHAEVLAAAAATLQGSVVVLGASVARIGQQRIGAPDRGILVRAVRGSGRASGMATSGLLALEFCT